MELNLQYFGGRGSGGGKGSAGGGGTKMTPETKVMFEAWEKEIPAGTYAMKGVPEETMEIEYRQANDHAVEMYVDGHSSAKMYVQYDGEWRMEDYMTGTTRAFSSPRAAARSLRPSMSDYRKVRTKK